MKHRIYNILTWIWHRLLHVPIRLAKVSDTKTRDAKLVVVFLHGISATSNTWRATYQQFTKDPELKDVRLVLFDLLGFGKSLRADWLNYDEEEYNKALDRSLKKLKTEAPVVIVGHSMGSLIAADYAVNYEPSINLRELILVSPPLLMADELAKLPDKVYMKSYGALHQFAMDVPAADVIAKLVQRFSTFRSDYLKTIAFERSMDRIILNRKNYHTFVKIHIPTLIIHGHFDPLVMGANLRRALKHNKHYLRYKSVIGHHDISVGKRAKILIELKKVLKEELKNEAI